MQFVVFWLNEQGESQDSEVLEDATLSLACVRAARRFVNRTEPPYARGFIVRQRRMNDKITLQGSLRQRKAQGMEY